MKSIQPVDVTPTMSVSAQPDSVVHAAASGTNDPRTKNLQHPGSPRYLSGITQIDPQTGVAVLAVRDTQSGKLIDERPSRRMVEEYQRLQQAHDLNAVGDAKNAQSSSAHHDGAGLNGNNGGNANGNGTADNAGAPSKQSGEGNQRADHFKASA